jgi:hypothetical protein
LVDRETSFAPAASYQFAKAKRLNYISTVNQNLAVAHVQGSNKPKFHTESKAVIRNALILRKK